MRDAFRILIGRQERNGRLWRPRRKWADNIKMDPKEIGCEGVDWIRMYEDKVQWRCVVNTAISLRVS
jgi:hypothetical protein